MGGAFDGGSRGGLGLGAFNGMGGRMSSAPTGVASVWTGAAGSPVSGSVTPSLGSGSGGLAGYSGGGSSSGGYSLLDPWIMEPRRPSPILLSKLNALI